MLYKIMGHIFGSLCFVHTYVKQDLLNCGKFVSLNALKRYNMDKNFIYFPLSIGSFGS